MNFGELIYISTLYSIYHIYLRNTKDNPGSNELSEAQYFL